MATVPKRVLCGLQLGAPASPWLPSAAGVLGMLHADTVDVVTSLLLLCIAPTVWRESEWAAQPSSHGLKP